jgi:hypothetical protein
MGQQYIADNGGDVTDDMFNRWARADESQISYGTWSRSTPKPDT